VGWILFEFRIRAKVGVRRGNNRNKIGVLYGVVTEICVDHAARGLIRRHFRVHLVEDAVRSLDSDRGQATGQCIRKHGGLLLTTSEVLDLCRGTPPDSHLETTSLVKEGFRRGRVNVVVM
jgi:isochorismate hydrolase